MSPTRCRESGPRRRARCQRSSAVMSRLLGRLRPTRDGAGRMAPMERRRLAMSKVVLDVSMSLDGFSAGPNVREEEPMGDGGERLHEWQFGPEGGVDGGGRDHRTAYLRPRCGPWGGTPWPGLPSLRGHPPDQGGPSRRQRRHVRVRWARGPGPACQGCRWGQDRHGARCGRRPAVAQGRACSTRCTSTSSACCWGRARRCSPGSGQS